MFSRIFLLFFLHFCYVDTFEKSPHYNVLQKLFGNNSFKITHNVIPMTENNTAVIVNIRLALHQILDLNEKNEMIRLNFWLRINWSNPFLKWNPENFDGVTSIVVDSTKIWRPDLTLWNRAVEQQSLYERMDKRIRVDSNGNCLWKSLVTTTSSCTIQVKHFPFDEQRCVLQLGSWHHPSKELVFSLGGASCIDTSHFAGSREWTVQETFSETKRELYPEDGYFDVIYCSVNLRRHAMFYIVNMVIPCGVIGLLGCLTFFLPPTNGERVSVVITVLLAMTVYMLIVAESMPAAAKEIPLVEVFYLVTIFETSLCLVGTCIVVRWYDHTGPMPKWIYVIFNCYLPKLLFVKYNNGDTETRDSITLGLQDTNIDDHSSNPSAPFAVKTTKTTGTPLKSDWQLASKTLNKFFLLFFTFLFICTTIAIFRKA